MAQSFFRKMIAGIEKTIFGPDTEVEKRRRKPPEKKPGKPAPSRLSSPNPIADRIMEYEPINLKKVPRSTFAALAKRWDLSSPYIKTERDYATAFLFGVISDRMIKADRAWRVPFELAGRLKHLDAARIAAMSADELEAVLRKPTNLHRFNAAMAQAFIECSKHLVDEHDGSALNMLRDGVQASELLVELESIRGISHKLSAMTLQILVTQLGIAVENIPSVDVAVDRHVARVFLRTGLVAGEPGRTVYRAAELKPSVLAAARKASPAFPAALDLGAFWIGKRFCVHAKPKCGECPLSEVCPKKRKNWAVGVTKGDKVASE